MQELPIHAGKNSPCLAAFPAVFQGNRFRWQAPGHIHTAALIEGVTLFHSQKFLASQPLGNRRDTEDREGITRP